VCAGDNFLPRELCSSTRLKQAEAGQAVSEVCRQMGISEATFYVWKKRYANLGTLEMRELRQLREENAKLKRLIADLTLAVVLRLSSARQQRGACPDAGARDVTAAVRLRTSAHSAQTRRLARQSQSHPSAVQAGGNPGTHESASAQASEPTSRGDTGSECPRAVLGDGLRA